MSRHMSKLLVSKHWEVLTAPDVARAIASYKVHLPQAVLADFVLEQGSTGLQAIEAIFAVHAAVRKAGKATSEAIAARPVAALLTQAVLDDADALHAKKLGVPVIQKPKYGKEHDFLQDVYVWLADAGVVSRDA